jgi:hypothetical protein
MLSKIYKLIDYSKNIDNNIYNKLIVIAEKINSKKTIGKKYLLIDIKEMESIVSPDKVDSKDNILGKVELEI